MLTMPARFTKPCQCSAAACVGCSHELHRVRDFVGRGSEPYRCSIGKLHRLRERKGDVTAFDKREPLAPYHSAVLRVRPGPEDQPISIFLKSYCSSASPGACIVDALHGRD